MARLVSLAIGCLLLGCSGSVEVHVDSVDASLGGGGAAVDASSADVCTGGSALGAGGSSAVDGAVDASSSGGANAGGSSAVDAGFDGAQGLGGFSAKGGSTGLGGAQAGGSTVGGHLDSGAPDVQCVPRLTTDGFVCCDGMTIPATWVCDGRPDCSSGADERGCPSGDGGVEAGAGGSTGTGGASNAGGSSSGGATGVGGAGVGGWQSSGGASNAGGTTSAGGSPGLGGSAHPCTCAPAAESYGVCLNGECIPCEFIGAAFRNCNLDDSDQCETYTGLDPLGGTKPCPP